MLMICSESLHYDGTWSVQDEEAVLERLHTCSAAEPSIAAAAADAATEPLSPGGRSLDGVQFDLLLQVSAS